MNILNKIKCVNQLSMTFLVTILFACGGGGSGENSMTAPPQQIADTTPNNFTFTEKIDVEVNTLIESDIVTITGIDSPADISIVGGEYSIDGAAFISSSATISPEQTIQLRLLSSSEPLTATESVLTVGGVSSIFSVTTLPTLNPQFIERAQAITYDQIQIYEGHVTLDDRTLTAANLGSLESGDLVTIDIGFELIGLQEYALTAQLIPMSLFEQKAPGNTLGEILDVDFIEIEGEEVIDLGGTFISGIENGTGRGLIHTKLPTLDKDIEYRLMIAPSIPFLENGTASIKQELQKITVHFSDETLVITRLDVELVKVITPPILIDDNDFTQLLIIDNLVEEFADGFSNEALFQTSIAVDVTSFKASAELVVSLAWHAPDGSEFPLGLVSSDLEGEAQINTAAKFTIARNGGSAIKVPVAAYATPEAYQEMIQLSTNIQDLANTEALVAEFILSIGIENGESTTLEIPLSLPLINQELRPQTLNFEELIGFTVLRAGTSNNACFTIPSSDLDIDSGLFPVDSTADLTPAECKVPAPSEGPMLWRYDTTTKQFINFQTDLNGDNYCIEAIDVSVISQNITKTAQANVFGNFAELRVKKCRFQESTLINPVPEGTAADEQRFNFIDNKITLLFNDRKVIVNAIGTLNADIELTDDHDLATDIFRDTEGLVIDNNGRLFYLGDDRELSVGEDGVAKITIGYGGEIYVDYLPVIGITNNGYAYLTANLFGVNLDLASAEFIQKQYLTKQISAVSGNLHPITVGNGALANFNVIGFPFTKGEMINTTITESFDPTENINDILNGEGINQDLLDLNMGSGDFNEELFSATVAVAGIPITFKGGAAGKLQLLGDLRFEGVGIKTSASSNFELAATVSAEVDAFVASAGVEAELELIKKAISFDASGGFDSDVSTAKLTFEVASELAIDIKVLKGELLAFVEYPRICFCSSIGETVRKEKTLFSSNYLINFNASLLKGEQAVSVIDL
ncbi:MAG: hypothetical protein ABJH06_03675 [Paraglaciecola sp.]|uniref:hypothetical protein n=1 Tax=Paraglaciecola sp. TaxID=1920173 RepID=UPI003299F316